MKTLSKNKLGYFSQYSGSGILALLGIVACDPQNVSSGAVAEDATIQAEQKEDLIVELEAQGLAIPDPEQVSLDDVIRLAEDAGIDIPEMNRTLASTDEDGDEEKTIRNRKAPTPSDAPKITHLGDVSLSMLDSEEGRALLRSRMNGGRPVEITAEDQQLSALLRGKNYEEAGQLFSLNSMEISQTNVQSQASVHQQLMDLASEPSDLLIGNIKANTGNDGCEEPDPQPFEITDHIPPKPPELNPDLFPSLNELDLAASNETIRYACCSETPLQAGPSSYEEELAVYPAGTAFWIKDIVPNTPSLEDDLKKAGSELKKCLEGNGDCSLVDILNKYDLNSFNLYAKVEVPAHKVYVPFQGYVTIEAAEGYVPLLYTLANRLKPEVHSVNLEASYRLISRELDKAIVGLFNKETTAQTCISTSDYTAYYDPSNEIFYSCSDPENPYKSDCDACEAAQNGGGVNSYEECVANLPEGFDPKVFCKDANYNEPVCHNWVPKNSSMCKYSKVSYETGEYPIGRTNYGGQENSISKRLVSFPLWGSTVTFDMKRRAYQKSFEMAVKDLKNHGNLSEKQKSSWVSGEHFRYNLQPVKGKDSQLNFEFCADLPGVEVSGNHVDFENSKTYKGFVDAISWGKFGFNRLEACMLGKLTAPKQITQLDQFAFDVEITDVTQFKIYGATLSGFDLKWSPKYYATTAAATLFLGGFAPSLATAVFAALISVPEILEDSINKNWGDWEISDIDNLQNATGFSASAALTDFLPVLNEQIDKALKAGMPDVPAQVEDIRAAITPSVGYKDPLYPFYLLLEEQTGSFFDHFMIEPIIANPDSAEEGCYQPGVYNTVSDPMSNWNHTYANQTWFTGQGTDSGCRIGARLSYYTDPHIHDVLSCAVHEANDLVNNSNLSISGLMSRVTTNCQDQGLALAKHFFGDKQDLQKLLQHFEIDADQDKLY